MGQVAFFMVCAGCLGQKGRHFGCVSKSLQTGKQSSLEGKVCEGWQLEARLEKLVVPDHEVLKHSARGLDLLCSEEALKGACESLMVTWLQSSAAGCAVSCSS